MLKKRIALSIATIMIALTASACGGTSDGNKQGSETLASSAPTSPVALVFMSDVAVISDEEVDKLVKEPIKAKYPHITVEYKRANTKGNEGLEAMLAA
ncbi:hypothetical protein FE783_30715 [Paenibacillus mesophilus]|uniref:hypothetical protein n=1 Tax=Paenibacillus mesophilus TaxID=2582849 RepID=UPI00110D56BB|nr:hypothetical protein [Paenibacillus mesophilus]TMV45045.1 hypothetical protein FE783_30715 [Paenibacillus mesophilus]